MNEASKVVDAPSLTQSDGVVAESGIDVVAISRLRRLRNLDDVEFIRRTFTEDEISYCEATAYPAEHYAGRWCVKEAVKKTVDSPGQVSLREVAVEKEGPKPTLSLSENAREILEETVGTKLSDDGVDTTVNLSHDRESGIAVGSVVIVRCDR